MSPAMRVSSLKIVTGRAEDLNLAPLYVMRDNDTKFTAHFDATIESSGATIKRNTPVSPNLMAHVERFIQSLSRNASTSS